MVDFVWWRFGWYVFECLVDFFVSGVFVGDLEKLSVNVVFFCLGELE